MKADLAELALCLADALEPLRDRLSSPEALEFLFARYGWRVSLDDTAFAALSEALDVRDAVEALVDLAGRLRGQLAAGGSLGVDDVAAIAEALGAAIEGVRGLGDAAAGGLPAPLDDTAFWRDVGAHLGDDLLEEYLRVWQPALYLVLHAGGVIRYEPTVPEGPFRRRYRRIVFDWRQARALASDPAGALRDVYGWGVPGEALNHGLLVDVLARVLPAVRIAADRRMTGLAGAALPPDAPVRIVPEADSVQATFLMATIGADRATVELGLRLMIAARAGEAKATGIVLSPVVRGAAEGRADMRGLTLGWSGSASLGDAAGVAVFPGDVSLAGGDATLGVSVEVADPGPAPRLLLGSPRTARVDVSGPSLRLSVEGTATAPEARLRLGTGPAGARLVVPLDEADGFVRETVPANALDLAFAPEVIWSTASGLTVNGSPRLAVDLPLRSSIGGVRVHSLHLGLSGGEGDAALRFEASAGLDVTLGPVTATIDRLGLAIDWDFGTENRNLGFVDLGFGLKPPSGIGIAVEAPGVGGGGYLGFDPARGQYSGVLRLTLEGGLTLGATGLITTRLPDGRRGFSLLAVITAEDFQPVPLGLGFSLTGVGGLLAVNRTCDDDFLRAGLRTGALDDILFPADPIRDAGRILATLDRAFPTRSGSFVFGPVLKIGWGTPEIVRMALAAVLELGARTRLVVLGRVSAIMPTEENDLLRLQMSALGVVDFDRRTVALDAVLYDSRLAGRFPVTGAMALRLAWGGERVFALSIGGFHPAFRPPPAFPALERLAITFSNTSDFRLRAEAYVAITANTVQFGARLELFASAGGFAVAGHVGIDVLIQLDPFGFLAGFEASVQLRYRSQNLFKVSVKGEIAGPRPLRIRGKASFEIFWCDVSVRFDQTLVAGERPEGSPPVVVMDRLRAALDDPRSWTGGLSDAERAVAVLREAPGDGSVALHPLARLTVRQTVVPLDLEIARFGGAVPADASRFALGPVLVGGASVGFERVEDFFAPAQFLDLDDAERLAAPSFEPMVAGVTLDAAGALFTTDPADMLEDDLAYDTFLIDGEAAVAVPPSPAPPDLVERYLSLGAAGRAALRQAGRARYGGGAARNAVERAGWAVASREDGSGQAVPGVAAGEAVSYAKAFQAVAGRRGLMLVRVAGGAG